MMNKMYIEDHNNNNAESAGYTLAMNSFGDLVSEYKINYIYIYS